MSGATVAHLGRRYRFSASHRLHVDGMTAERNREVFGRCNNPHGHGHNYTLQVTVSGPIDSQTGMVVNLADLDSFVKDHLLERFHLVNLNEDPALKHLVPSTENFAAVLWDEMQPFVAQHPTLRLHRIRVEETSNNAFDYLGQGHGGEVRTGTRDLTHGVHPPATHSEAGKAAAELQ